MAFENSLSNISLSDHVRFNEDRLALLTAADKKRLEGRVGVVQGYWNATRKLIVAFPEHSGRPVLRILGVDPRQLERVVEEEIPAGSVPEVDDETTGDAKLSQDDLDNLFG